MSEFLRLSSAVWSLLHILVLFAFFYSPRFSKKKTAILTLVTMIPLLMVNMLLLYFLGRQYYAWIVLFVLVLPSFVFFFFLSKYRDFRFIFTFCLVDTVSIEIIIISILADTFLGGDKCILMFIIRILAFPLMELAAAKKLRKPYLEIQNSLPKGWGAFSLVSVVFYMILLVMMGYPDLITSRPEDVPVMILMLALMPLMYLNIFQVLFHQNRIHGMEREQEILSLQAGHMQQRLRQTAEMEEKIRIERHDLRHRLMTVGAMLEKEEYDEARKYIDKSAEHLDAQTVKRYCKNPVMDAVFASYFEQAAAHGIKVETKLAVPKNLEIDETEISVVVANALENAIHACEKLPTEKRIIKCRWVSRPQHMFQISNPYAGIIVLDESGRPASSQAHHGIGTRSIAAFCEKHGAFADYKIEDGWFHLRIVLMD